MDLNGNYLPNGATVYSSPIAGEQLKVLKASKGLLCYLLVCNTTASKIYVHVYDHASAASGSPIMPPIPVPANDAAQVPVLGVIGAIPFSTGCVVAASTAQASYAAAGANALQVLAVTK